MPVNKDAKVVVNKVVHPGVEITIGESTMSILDEYRGTTFYLSGDEIKNKKVSLFINCQHKRLSHDQCNN